MSKLVEYLKLLPRGLANADKVLEGLWNEVKSLNGSLPEDEQQEILRRRLICKSCPFYSLNANTSEEYFNVFNKHYNTDRVDSHCSVCGCNEQMKTSSLESDCGIKQSEETKELDFKWTKYNKPKQ